MLLTFHSPREASPVCKDHQGQPFSVEVLDCLGCFEGRVGEPHLPSLLDYLVGSKMHCEALEHIGVRVKTQRNHQEL